MASRKIDPRVTVSSFPPLRMLAEPESGLADVVAKCLLQRAKDACDLADRELDSNLEYEVMSGSPNPAKLLYLHM